MRIAGYDALIAPAVNADETQPWHIPTPDLEQRRRNRQGGGESQKLHRRGSQRNRKIKREDLINVLSRNEPSAAVLPQDLLEDEVIPGKAIVLKMPERGIKSYFIPLPIDLDVNFPEILADVFDRV